MHLLPFGLDTTLFALAGASQAGGAMALANTSGSLAQVAPTMFGLVVVVSGYAAGGSTTGFDVIVQTAPTATGTFANTLSRINQIVANGTYTIPVADPILIAARVNVVRGDGAATANITIHWLANAPLA